MRADFTMTMHLYFSLEENKVNYNHCISERKQFTQSFINNTVVLFSFVTKTAINRLLMAQRWVTSKTDY